MTEEETKTEETKSDEPKKVDDAKIDPPIDGEPKIEAKPTTKPKATTTTTKAAAAPARKPSATGWRPSWYRVGMGDLFIGIALLIAGTVVAMRTPTRWYGAFIVGTIETVHGLYLLSKKKS